MIKARWIWATAATIAILASLGAGLWFGGGPTTRGGWEAASWAAGITTALALIVTAITRAATSSRSSAPPSSPGSAGRSDVANTVNGNVHGSTVIQGRDVHVEHPSYGGDHIDFHGGTFNGTVIGKQVNQPAPQPGNDGREPER